MVNVELMLVLAAPALVQAREGGLRIGNRASTGTPPRYPSPTGVEYDPYAQQDWNQYGNPMGGFGKGAGPNGLGGMPGMNGMGNFNIQDMMKQFQ